MEGAPRRHRRDGGNRKRIEGLRRAARPVALWTVLLAALASGAAGAAERIVVRIGNHAGYDRAVFDWPGQVGYDVAADDRKVRITFDEAAELDLGPMLRKFGAVATGLTTSTANGRTELTFALPDRVQLKHFRNEKSIVLDFVRTATPQAPALDPASTRALAQERRAKRPADGEPPAAAAAAAPAASPAAVPAATRPPAVPAENPRRASGDTLIPPPPPASNDGLAATPNPALVPPRPLVPSDPPAAATPVPPASAAPPASVASPAAAAAPTPAMAAPAATPAPATSPATAAATPATPPSSATAAPAPATPPAPATAASAPATASATPSAPANPSVAAPPPAAASMPEARPETPPEAREASEVPALAPPPPPQLVVGPLPTRTVAAGERVAVEVQASAVGYRLRVPLREAAGVAAFMRGSVAWIVFDARVGLDIGKLAALRQEIGVADTMVVEAPVPATVLRIAVPGRGGVGVGREGGAWIFELGPRAPAALRPVDPVVRGNPDGSGGRLVVDLPGGRPALRIKDPEVKDELQIVPTTTLGAAVAVGRSYADFRVLPAAQGLVVAAGSDKVVTRFAGELVEVVGGVALAVTEGSITAGGAEAPRRQQLFDIAGWRKDGKPVDERKQDLNRAVALAPAASRGNHRLALAQFQFANGMYHEALGQLRILANESPKTAALPATRLLHAASALMADDLEDAERTIAHASLAANNEAALWRGLLMLKQGDARNGLEFVRRGMEFAERYPPPVGPRIAIAIAETHILAAQVDEGARFLDLAQRQPLADSDRKRIALLRGRVLARQGDVAGAVARWNELEQGLPSPARTEAVIARVETQVAAKQIDRGQGIETLDRLRYGWRGDRLELETLLALSRLHVQGLNHRAALNTLREAAANFPQAREAGVVLSEMDLVFAKLFLDGEAKKLPPVQAIALFDEFRDLVPMGARGDQMVRNLVDRLVQVDLLDRAVQILEHQVKHRATPADKPELGARLAIVRLMDGNPEAALVALRETDSPEIAPEVAFERKRVAARAYAELGRGAEAVVELAGDTSEGADRLRADVYRQVRDWKAAAEALARLTGEPPEEGAELRDGQGRDVIHLATALGLAGDEGGLRALRDRFGPAMAKSPYKGVFDVVAGERGEVPADMEAIAKRIETVAPYQSFLDAYRARFDARSGGGS